MHTESDFPLGAELRVGSFDLPERASGHHVVQHVSFGEWEPSSLGFLRALTGKQYRRCGVLRKRAWEVQVLTLLSPV